ncbi:MAG: YebC/PmpR family DNA-binding transcriptional regulator [Anaerolineales bacterium]|nr:YebC/PmpR family DNA-binding transcriptional regulator [Anaerolineales bacterium]
MSGHSKWSTIKRKKGATDAKRGQLFTKLGREIVIAAGEGGDPTTNFKLRLAVDKARMANMPKDNIQRAIRRGTGAEKGAELVEVRYEGYGPHGVALLVHVLTDNRNRAVSEVRRAFNRYGGSMGESGCVAWLFESKGYITISRNDSDPDELALLAIDAGADDVTVGSNLVEVFTMASDFQRVKEELEKSGITLDSAEIAMLPKSLAELGEKETIKAMILIDALEELEDVQQVSSNLNITDEIMAKYELVS